MFQPKGFHQFLRTGSDEGLWTKMLATYTHYQELEEYTLKRITMGVPDSNKNILAISSSRLPVTKQVELFRLMLHGGAPSNNIK